MSGGSLAERNAITDELAEYFARVNTEESLKKSREKAWNQFLSLGLPTEKSEVYKYIKINRLLSLNYRPSSETPVSSKDVEPFIQPESRNSAIVFVNGRYSAPLSRIDALPPQVSVSGLSEAALTFGTFLHNHWTKVLKEETDPFAALNAAMSQGGLFLYIPPKTVVESPIQILHILSHPSDEKSMVSGRVHVFAGVHSECTIFSTQHSLQPSGRFINNVVDVSLEEGSRVRYTQILCNQHSDTWHLDSFRAHLKKNATLNTVAVTEGAGTVRNDYRIILSGENAEAFLNGVWMLSDKKEAHSNVFMEHASPNCRSYQLFKGVVNDYSRSAFEGKIMVRSEAQKTEAFQLNNNIVLSDYAHAAAKPNLEIFADDVKASHGATVGRLDSEQLFYMRTRGFPEREAKNMLIYGFCEQVIDMIPVPSLKTSVSERARKYLTNGKV